MLRFSLHVISHSDDDDDDDDDDDSSDRGIFTDVSVPLHCEKCFELFTRRS